MPAHPSHELPLITRSQAVRELMSLMDRCALGITLVVDEDRRLEATITDGDVRRAILLGIELDQPVSDLLSTRKGNGHPITASLGTPPEELCRLMAESRIRQIPLLDAEERVVDIALDSDYLAAVALPLDGFIMAGGFGKRLMPLTENCPKPMLPVNGKPILEHLVEKLRATGIQHVSISTHYLAESIVEHFQDGKDFGVHIEYVDEERPMGTAGALARASVGELPLLVINGDILTSIDFRAMLEFHREHQADMTVAVQQHETKIPYGVIHMEGIDAVSIEEKPLVRHFINAGIYLIQPSVCRMVPADRAFDMPELITSLIDTQKRVICFPIREHWVDVGQMEQYERASTDAQWAWSKTGDELRH
ncbi:nucleotidyltransferase family protein [Granulicella mallensis]|uniref:dTDP-glucose pyrophosphorylase/CBS domain-containing protein n=1 Tax=Granulicella mallensis TaxID=940614 RepID=A0A7W7ZVC4_9BACT|nr:nucleotidyltransferase family protein [Granulicella mallensis]MBB5066463.1 dTDP-glucose pyrophosphorylase/CBS domain-containing protein [Granulicella mallensis]